jgi:hypothetical protein
VATARRGCVGSVPTNVADGAARRYARTCLTQFTLTSLNSFLACFLLTPGRFKGTLAYRFHDGKHERTFLHAASGQMPPRVSSGMQTLQALSPTSMSRESGPRGPRSSHVVRGTCRLSDRRLGPHLVRKGA